MHPCKCPSCKNAVGLDCAWRRNHDDFLKKPRREGTLKEKIAPDGLTYCQLADMAHVPLPVAARTRNMLNIMALLPECENLGQSYAVLDITQSIDRTSLRTDGQMFTIGTGSVPFIMKLARELEVKRLVTLCGLPDTVDFGNQTESAVRKMLGNCMHTADIGALAAAAIFLKMGVL